MHAAPFARARELHTRAVQLYNRGQPARALTALHRARALLDTDKHAAEAEHASLAARIWISIALNEAEVRSLDAGFAALAEAEELVKQADDPRLQVLLHCQRGLIELRGGSLARSRSALDAAAELLEHAEPHDQASILINRGNVALAESRLDDARRDFARAAETAEHAGLTVEHFKSLHNLAYVDFLRGDLSRALRLMSEAQRIDLGQEWGIVLLDRARILTEAGLAREADDALSQAGALFARYRVAQDLAETELERARCALAVGEVQAARRFAGAARRRFGRRGSDRWRRSAELLLLQAELAAGRPGARLEPQARRLAEEFDGLRLRLHARAARLLAVEASLAAGRHAAAARQLADLGPARADDPVTGRMHDHLVHARVAAATGRRSDATRRVRRALDELARYQASFGSIDLRTAAAVHGRRLAELDITVALQDGRPNSVFAAVERARAVSSRLPPVRPPDDPIAAELLSELRQTVESLRAVEQDRPAFERLLRKRRELEKQIVARSWTVSGSGAVARPATFEQVRTALGVRERMMVTYVQAGETLSALVIGRRASLLHLGPAAPVIEQVRRVRADLDVLARRTVPNGIRSSVRTSLQRSLAALDETLVASLPVAAGPLLLVSTGVLSQLPWASLPGLRGRSLVVAPSATKWLASIQESSMPSTRVVALAGPALDRGAAEAAAVGHTWPVARVHGAATTAELLDAAASATVLHVAAHGVHQPENPLFSSLRMADGPVFAHELDQRGHAPEHVVLSACEVGLATIRPGDEALGLASVLLNLGTRSVLASVARVGDEVAEQTMVAYHRRLAGGADSAAALAQALEEVDADVVPPFVNFGAAWHLGDLAPADPLA